MYYLLMGHWIQKRISSNSLKTASVSLCLLPLRTSRDYCSVRLFWRHSLSIMLAPNATDSRLLWLLVETTLLKPWSKGTVSTTIDVPSHHLPFIIPIHRRRRIYLEFCRLDWIWFGSVHGSVAARGCASPIKSLIWCHSSSHTPTQYLIIAPLLC